MKHVDGALYLVTFIEKDGTTENCPLVDTIDECIEWVYNYQEWHVDCKIRAIHDADGAVRDVSEDIGRVMIDRSDYTEHDWPIWAHWFNLRASDFYETEPEYDYDPNDDL